MEHELRFGFWNIFLAISRLHPRTLPLSLDLDFFFHRKAENGVGQHDAKLTGLVSKDVEVPCPGFVGIKPCEHPVRREYGITNGRGLRFLWSNLLQAELSNGLRIPFHQHVECLFRWTA